MKTLLLAASLALLPALTLANGYSVPNVNPRDMGAADALVSAQNDAAAVYANPAALSRLCGLSLSLAGSMLQVDGTWTTTTGLAPSPVSTQFDPAFPPAVFLSYSGRIGDRGWGVGVGFNVPFGGNLQWPPGPGEWPGRYQAIEVNRRVYGFYLTAGFEVVKQLRIGGGLVYERTTEKVSQAVSPLFPDTVANVGTAGGGFGFDVSGEIQPVVEWPLVFGVDYKHQVVQNLTGDLGFVAVPPALAATLQPQSVTHAFTTPNVLNAGVTWRFKKPDVLVAFGYTFERYVVYEADVFVGGKGLTITVPRNYGNGNVFRLGGEWTATKNLQVRLGGFYDMSGLKLNTYSPTLLDSDAWVVTGGLSWLFSKVVGVHAAALYTFRKSLTSDPSQGAFPGTYTGNPWIVSAGVTLNFGSDCCAEK
jgi:long-chain fatty acid transport protein